VGLVEGNVTRILFTNGMNDGWSVGGVVEDLSEGLVAVNFPNGAHHSDLSGRGPSEEDTEDVKRGYLKVQQILGGWLADVERTALGGEAIIS